MSERDPDRGRRVVLAVTIVLSVAVGAGGFGYAVWTNEHGVKKAQTTAEQAKNQQTYGLQVFCTVLDALERSRGLRTPAGAHDLALIRHYYAELHCDAVLQLPLVPLGATGATPSALPTERGHSLAPPAAPAPASRPPPAGPSPTPQTPGSPPPRTPSPRPPPSPSPSPSPLVTACVHLPRHAVCVGATFPLAVGDTSAVSNYAPAAVAVGPDTSNVNGRPVDAAWLKAHGIGWHAFKVTQGGWFLDRLAAANHAADAAHGILECRYHFAESDLSGPHPASGAAQADAFIAACAAAGGGCANHGHAVDVETQSGRLGPRYRVVTDFVARWRARMPGHPLGVYSGSWYWIGYLGNPAFPADWLWTSDYVGGRGDPFALLKGVTPGYWHPWGGRHAFDLRQFSSSAAVDGINPCDVSVHPSTVASLRDLWLPSSARPVAAPPATVAHVAPAGWKPPAEVVALQEAWNVTPHDGRWGATTDAHAQAVRRNRHDVAEQVACGTKPDGRWGKASEAAYHETVAQQQTALNRGLPARQRLKVDGWWGKVTDAAWAAARAKWYRHYISG